VDGDLLYDSTVILKGRRSFPKPPLPTSVDDRARARLLGTTRTG
jgi:hypothetical protein